MTTTKALLSTTTYAGLTLALKHPALKEAAANCLWDGGLTHEVAQQLELRGAYSVGKPTTRKGSPNPRSVIEACVAIMSGSQLNQLIDLLAAGGESSSEQKQLAADLIDLTAKGTVSVRGALKGAVSIEVIS